MSSAASTSGLPAPGGAPTPEQMMKMMMGPAAPPPPGVVSNFEHPESRVNMATGLFSFILATMLICTSLRVYAKAKVAKAFGWEDWSCIIAAILNVGYTAVAYIALQSGGLGLHIWDIRLKDIMNDKYFNTLIASQSLYPVALFFTKLSILLLVYRIFWAQKRAVLLVWLGIITNALFYGITFILTVAWCAPGSGKDPMVSAAAKTCQTDVHRLSIVQSCFNIGSDLYLLVIPIPLVFGLKTSMSNKVKVSFIFALGLIATILSAINLYFRVESLRTIDSSWIYIPVYICSIYELNLGVVCVCLPCFPVLLKTDGMQRLLSSRPWTALSSALSSRFNLPSKNKSSYDDTTLLKKDITKTSVNESSFEHRETGSTYHSDQHV